MSEDVYLRDHGVYISEINRKGFVGRLLRQACQVARGGPAVRALASGSDFDLMTWWSSGEYIVDFARGGLAFENVVKGRILLSGYVVHRIEQREARELARRQQKKGEAIAIEDMKAKLPFVYDERAGLNRIVGLSTKTLSLSEVLPHQDLHGLPPDVVDGLGVVRNVRDTLHYLEAEPGDIDFAVLGDLLNYMERTVVPEVNAIANDLSWPALRLEP